MSPWLAIGTIVTSGGSVDLAQTRLHVESEQSLPGLGAEADYVPETRTVYLVISGRLWYVQLIGGAPTEEDARRILVTLGGDLARLRAVR